MASDSIKKTFGVALGVCLVCSVLVASTVVALKPKQEENKKLDKLKNILVAGDLMEKGKDVEAIYNEKVKPVIVNLETGDIIPESEYDAELDPKTYDIKDIVKKPEYTKPIPPEKDMAKIKVEPKDMLVYLVMDKGEMKSLILPIYGKGLWSTMYGLMALDKDLVHVKGFTFYEHGETPGLGGEVDNPNWKAEWVGKKIFDDNWNLEIQVIKGKVDKEKPDAVYKVDGLSGSTLTTRGVNNLVRFWLGPDGYGKFLEKVREEGLHE